MEGEGGKNALAALFEAFPIEYREDRGNVENDVGRRLVYLCLAPEVAWISSGFELCRMKNGESVRKMWCTLALVFRSRSALMGP